MSDAGGPAVGVDPSTGSQAERRVVGHTKWTFGQGYLVAALLLVSICNYADRGILALVQEPLKAELGLRDADLGLISGPAFAMLYALAGIPLARLAERVDRVRLLAAMTAIWSAFTALCGVAGNLASLIAFRLGVGFAEGGGVPISHSLLSDSFRLRQRGLAMAVLSAGQPAAAMLTPVVAAYVASVWGWRTTFFVIGLPGLLLALLVITTLRDPRTAPARKEAAATPHSLIADLRWLFGNRSYAWLYVAGAFMGMGNGGVGVFLVSFIMREHERTLLEAGTVMGFIGLMGLLGTIVGGYLADRFTGARGRSYPLVCAIGAFVAALMYWLAFAQAAWSGAMAFLLLAGIATDIKNGPNFAAVQNIPPPRMRATAAAIYMTGPTLIGFSIGPPLTGFLSDHFAAAQFASAGGGSFEALCSAGGAAVGAASAACADASAAGLTRALMIVNLAYVASAFAFWRCSRHFMPYEMDDPAPEARPA